MTLMAAVMTVTGTVMTVMGTVMRVMGTVADRSVHSPLRPGLDGETK
jgi:hypothetical protein